MALYYDIKHINRERERCVSLVTYSTTSVKVLREVLPSRYAEAHVVQLVAPMTTCSLGRAGNAGVCGRGGVVAGGAGSASGETRRVLEGACTAEGTLNAAIYARVRPCGAV